MRDRNDLSLQLSRLERELASTEGELHRVQMERDSALRSHSPSQSDSTTDRLKVGECHDILRLSSIPIISYFFGNSY